MSKYLVEITESLIRVLKGATGAKDHRLNGYAANLSFWADEVAHCFTALDGFKDRQLQFSQAAKQAIAEYRERNSFADPTQLFREEATSDWEMQSFQTNVSNLSDRLQSAAKGFFRTLGDHGLLSQEQAIALEERFPFLQKKGLDCRPVAKELRT